MSCVIAVLSASIKWSELDKNDKIVIKTKKCETQEQITKFRKKLEKSDKLHKIIGESQEVIYEPGYNPYTDRMEYSK